MWFRREKDARSRNVEEGRSVRYLFIGVGRVGPEQYLVSDSTRKLGVRGGTEGGRQELPVQTSPPPVARKERASTLTIHNEWVQLMQPPKWGRPPGSWAWPETATCAPQTRAADLASHARKALPTKRGLGLVEALRLIHVWKIPLPPQRRGSTASRGRGPAPPGRRGQRQTQANLPEKHHRCAWPRSLLKHTGARLPPSSCLFDRAH